MANVLFVIALIIGAVLIAALAIAVIIIIAALATISYAVILPACYLLTVVLLLRRVPETEQDQDDDYRSEYELPSDDEDGLAGLPFSRPSRDRRQLDNSDDFFAPTKLGRSQDTAWTGRQADRAVARPSYFFGPAMDDLADVISAYLVRYSSCIAAGVTLMLFLADSDDLSGPGLIAAAGVLVGTVIGVLVGSLLTIAIHIVHVVVAVVTATVALISWGVLRSLDIICRLVAGVLMPCPDCHGTVKPYPTYVCPRCSERHHDIRPGSCGIAVRNCTCTARFPTSLLTGAGRLEAECPNCGSSLPARFGVMPEILIPVFGSLNVGKTQLMYTLTRAFDSIVTSNGTLVFEGDTPERLDRIKEDLVSKGRPDKTLPNTPSAYLMRIKVRLSERRIFIFDPAGELHYSIDGVNELNYLNKAKVFVYVIDPLASETLWAAISEENRGKLRDIRSSKSESELAYHHTREQMRRLGAKTQYARLAIVLSKADIVENVGIKLTASSADERKTLRDWVKDDLGMGNVVREAQHSFAQVEFFQTAALTSDADEPDESVEVLARWLLRSQGVNLKEAVTYRA